MQRLGGQDVDIRMGTTLIHAESVGLTITDETAITKTRGITNGFVGGSVAAEGDLEVDTENFKKMAAVARAAGSWRDMPVFDLLFYAKTRDEELKVEAFGVKLVLTDPANFDPQGSEKLKHKFKILVTSPDFIKIDGIPVLSQHDTRDLMG